MLNYKNYAQVRAKIWNDELPYIRIFRIMRSNDKTGQQDANPYEEFRSYALTQEGQKAGPPVLEEAIERLDRWYNEEAADIGRYSVHVSANGNSNAVWQELLLNVDKFRDRMAEPRESDRRNPPAAVSGPDNSELLTRLMDQNYELQSRLNQLTIDHAERERSREIEALRAEIDDLKAAPPKSGFSFEKIGELAAQHPDKAAQVVDMIFGLFSRFLSPQTPPAQTTPPQRAVRPRPSVSGVPPQKKKRND